VRRLAALDGRGKGQPFFTHLLPSRAQ